MLDDVHLLRSAGALGALRTVVEHVPDGCLLVLAGRAEPEIPIARLVTSAHLHRIDATSLAMTEDEGVRLLDAAGVEIDVGQARDLVACAEGWPAGLYLAALAVREHESPAAAATQFRGSERLVADYLRDEVLQALPAETLEFLLATSILDRLSGSACDAVTGSTGSAERLEQLARSNLFVVPLDNVGETYRYHHLFAEMLCSELWRRDAERARGLARRASAWCEGAGDLDSAIAHARAAGDLDRVLGLIWRVTPMYLGDGRAATVSRLLDDFDLEQRSRTPVLAVASAWESLTVGDVAAVDQWLGAAERFDPATVLPDGTPLPAAVALLSALVAKDGITQMCEDAERSIATLVDDSLFQAVAHFLAGSAQLLSGDTARARTFLDEAVRRSFPWVVATAAQALAQLAQLEWAEGDPREARRLVDRALGIVDEQQLSERPAMVLVYAAAAVLQAADGDFAEAREQAKHSAFLLDRFVGVAPWGAIEARVLLARVALMLGDLATARAEVNEADRLLARYPDSGSLAESCASVRRTVDDTASLVGGSSVALTPAEFRVLRMLPTHLSFGEIAGQLFVSRNTVKTQAIAVYRKFGVSSRAAAVEHAQRMGILER